MNIFDLKLILREGSKKLVVKKKLRRKFHFRLMLRMKQINIRSSCCIIVDIFPVKKAISIENSQKVINKNKAR